MKKIVLVLLVAFFGCEQKVDVAKINLINGYWQIQKVEDANDNEKDYKINEVYDYFELKDKNGFHKKVTWQPDGTFLVNDLQDEVKIILEKDKVFLNFISKYGKHSDELVSISNSEMVLKSKEEVSFYYSKVIIDKNNGKANK